MPALLYKPGEGNAPPLWNDVQTVTVMYRF
jgi:hypothetical protein